MPLLIPITTSSTDREIDCLARNVYYEARGESKRGQLAVALVTLNRTEDARFPNTICGVVFQKNQFSWTHGFRQHKMNPQQWQKAKDAAWAAYLDRDILGKFRATHFHNLSSNPGWRMRRVARIGQHVFYSS